MGVVKPLKVPSSALITFSVTIKFNPNCVNRYCPNTILYPPLADSSTFHFNITEFVELSAVKVKSNFTLILVVMFPAYVCHCVTAFFSGCSFCTILII